MSPKAAGWMLTFLLLLPIFLFFAPVRDARAQGPGGPTLLDVFPVRNAVTASVTTTITARYDQPMAAASVVSRTFVVHGMQSGVITQMHGLADTTTLQVTPNRSFHQGELVYAIATTGTTNITGTHPAAASQWQFNAGTVVSRCVGGFNDVGAGLAGVQGSSVAWGDYDSDGDLDILLTGYSDEGAISRVYRNTGGAFTVAYSLTGVYHGQSAWGDYDNDGKLDILLTGYTGYDPITQIYHNTGSGFELAYTLPGVFRSSVAWGDYDNDGRLDILLEGSTSGPRAARVYHNTGSGFELAYTLTTAYYGQVVWGDYDNDGDLDILLTGDSDDSLIAQVYQNTGSGFTLAYSLTGVYAGGAAWGDYDNDGDLDILITGSTDGSTLTEVYANTGGGFSLAYSLAGVGESSAAWGDYDNDGDLDILLAGREGSTYVTRVYTNTGSGFNAAFSYTGVSMGGVAWGDYDNDGDLDILYVGYSQAGVNTARLLRNDECSDLGVFKTVSPATAKSGETITYTVSFSNTGAGPSLGVSLTDIVPVTLTGISLSSSGVAITSTGGSPYVWQVKDLAPGEGGVITVTGALSQIRAPGVFTNTATIAGSGDPYPSNNTAAVAATHTAHTTTSLASSSNPSLDGETVTFTAMVTSTNGTPSGTVQFYADGAALGSPVILSSGQATITTTSLAIGTHPITATYDGGAYYLASAGALAGDQVVNGIPPTITSVDHTTMYVGMSSPFTVTATGTLPITVTGSVTMTPPSGLVYQMRPANGTGVLTGTLGMGTTGVYYIQLDAVNGYLPDASQTFTLTVDNPVPTLTAISPSSATAGALGFTLTLTGTQFVTDSVVMWNGSARTTGFVSTTRLTATIPASDLTSRGTYSVTVFNPTPGGGTSEVQTFIVGKTNTSLTLTAAPTMTVPAQTVTFTATLTQHGTAASGRAVKGVTPTGNVRFTFDGTTTVTLTIGTDGVATYATGSLALGTHSVTAEYLGDTNLNGSSSSPVTVAIGNPVPVLTAISPSSAGVGALGFTLTLTGTQFVTNSVVWWNGSARTTGFVSTTRLTATIPASDLTSRGVYSVTVFNPTPGGGASEMQIFTVGKTNTTLALIAAPTISLGARTFTFTATLTQVYPAASGRAVKDVTPTGIVKFTVDGTTNVTRSIGTNGVATYALSSLGVGSHTVTAEYLGDTNLNGSTSSTVSVQVNAIKTYLPWLGKSFVSAPNLAIQSLTATPSTLQVVLKNTGSTAVGDDFWVDVYINPSSAPTRANQTWPMLAGQGAVWGVTGSGRAALTPGGTLTLSLNDAYYYANLSSPSLPLAAGVRVYAQVDSANANTTYGSVRETHEINGAAYDNIGSTTVSGTGASSRAAAQTRTPSEGDLPARP